MTNQMNKTIADGEMETMARTEMHDVGNDSMQRFITVLLKNTETNSGTSGNIPIQPSVNASVPVSRTDSSTRLHESVRSENTDESASQTIPNRSTMQLHQLIASFLDKTFNSNNGTTAIDAMLRNVSMVTTQIDQSQAFDTRSNDVNQVVEITNGKTASDTHGSELCDLIEIDTTMDEIVIKKEASLSEDVSSDEEDDSSEVGMSEETNESHNVSHCAVADVSMSEAKSKKKQKTGQRSALQAISEANSGKKFDATFFSID